MFAKVLLFCLLGTTYLASIAIGYPRPQHPITTINIYTKPQAHPNSMIETGSTQYDVACLNDGSCTGGMACHNGVCSKTEFIQGKVNQLETRKVASTKNDESVYATANEMGSNKKRYPNHKTLQQPIPGNNNPDLEGEIVHSPDIYEPQRRYDNDGPMIDEQQEEDDYDLQLMTHYKQHDDMDLGPLDDRISDMDMNNVVGHYRHGDTRIDNYQPNPYQHHAEQYQDDTQWDQYTA